MSTARTPVGRFLRDLRQRQLDPDNADLIDEQDDAQQPPAAAPAASGGHATDDPNAATSVPPTTTASSAQAKRQRQYAKGTYTRRKNIIETRLQEILDDVVLTYATLSELQQMQTTLRNDFEALNTAHEAYALPLPDDLFDAEAYYMDEPFQTFSNLTGRLNRVILSEAALKLQQQHAPQVTPPLFAGRPLDTTKDLFGQASGPGTRADSPDRFDFGPRLHTMLNEAERNADISHHGSRPTTGEGATLTLQQLGGILGTNYNVSNHVNKFSGADISQYPDWRSQWETAAETMKSMGWTDGRRLRELKNCLEGKALNMIKGYMMQDRNYYLAMADLDEEFLDPTRHVRSLTDELMKVEPMKNDAASMQKVTTAVLIMVKQFEGLKLSGPDQAFVMLLALVEPKLNFNTKKAWLQLVKKKQSLSHPIGTNANIDDFIGVLREQTKLQEQLNAGKKPKEQKEKDQKTCPTNFSTQAGKCELCKAGHAFQNCPQLSNFRYVLIKEAANRAKICLRCFGQRGANHSCPTPKCDKCPKPHNSKIHDSLTNPNKPSDKNKEKGKGKKDGKNKEAKGEKSKEQKPEKESDKDEETSEDKKPVTALTSCNTQKNDNNLRGLLRTCRAYLIGPDGSKIMARVALDCCSQEQLIRRDRAQELGLDGPPCKLSMTVAGGKHTSPTNEHKVDFRIEALDGTYQTDFVTASTIKNISTPFDSIDFSPSDYEHLQDLTFTESYPLKDVQVDVLLGEPHYSHLECGEARKKNLYEPVAIKTKLGWVLAGNNPGEKKNKSVVYSILHSKVEKEIGLTDFWKQEHDGLLLEDTDLTVEDKIALDQMSRISSYDRDKQKWTTGLLWKENPNGILQDNFKRAFQVMRSVQRNISSPAEAKLLDDAYRAYLSQQHAVITSHEADSEDFRYYLETHPVFKLDRETTKCRIVMNASSKDRISKKSLNDLLHKGPDLLPSLAQVQMRFRLHKVAILLDISKMFLQIQLDEESSEALRFMWKFETDDRPTLMKMQVVTFGLISSPFQAIWVLQETAKMHAKRHPEAVEKILCNTYMDDLSSGAESAEEANKLLKTFVAIFNTASMKAHKFASNDPEALKNLPDDDISKARVVSVLGAKWDIKTDKLTYTFLKQDAEIPDEKPTKRIILSAISKIFDACGLISPFTLQGKLLMQKIWQLQIDWDEPLKDEPTLELWQNWLTQLPLLSSLSIPRHVGPKQTCFVAVFADASLCAYGACAYLVSGSGAVLLFSKTRVAPKKLAPTVGRKDEEIAALTIARLELLAAVCGAKVGKFVAQAINFPSNKIAYFSDSSITLSRIKKGPSNWKLWVGTRVAFILKLSDKDQWYYVPGENNPADLASRGCDVATLAQSQIWWNGPTFLQEDRKEWPAVPGCPAKERTADSLETKPNLQFKVKKTKQDPVMRIMNAHSSLDKMLRILSLARRYVLKLQAKVKHDTLAFPEHLTVKELDDSLDLCIKTAQRDAYPAEVEALQNGYEIDKRSSILQYNPYLDEKGILRSNSRLSHSKSLPEGSKFPILLPKKCHLSALIFLRMHEVNLHAGNETILSLSRKKYALMGGRQELRRILNKCKKKICRQPMPHSQQMAPLPPERSEMGRPFTHVGLDYFGPMYTRIGDNQPPKKVWACIFTCFSSRAIHLELVEDMTASEFLNAVKRLSARHGQPSVLYSDNAKTFKAADKELKKLFQKPTSFQIGTGLARIGITWSYAIAEAPHTNALTERMIRCVKKSLRVMLNNKMLTFRQLETLLIETEGIVNKRPLCAVRMNEEINPITPAELVLGRSLDLLPDPPKLTAVNLKEVWALRKTLLNIFWKRFYNDYLLELQPRKIWQKQPEKTINEGDVVLLRDDHLSRNDWRIARVETLHAGRDGLPRLVTLKKPNGQTIQRHISRLALLEAQ